MRAMENKETLDESGTKLPCFGTYDEKNYACHKACTDRARCREDTEAVDALPGAEAPVQAAELEPGVTETELLETVAAPTVPLGPEKPRPVAVPVVEEPVDELSTSPEAAKEVVSAPEQPVKTPVRTPVKTPVRTPVKAPVKPTKKGLIRELVGSGDRYSADDLIRAIVDKGFIKDTDAAKKSARTYVHMCISEFKRKHSWNILKDEEGKYYNADAGGSGSE